MVWYVIFFAILSIGCAPQAEFLKAQEDIENTRERIKETHRTQAEIEERLNTLQRTVEGLNPNISLIQKNQEAIETTQERIKETKREQEDIKGKIDAIQKSLEELRLSLSHVQKSQEETASTLIQLKKNESELKTKLEQIPKLPGDLTSRLDQIQKGQSEMQAKIEQAQKGRSELENKVTQISRNQADLGVKTDQIVLDSQLIQGKLEKDGHLLSELAQRVDDQGYRISAITEKLESLEARKPSDISKGTGQDSTTKELGAKGINPVDFYNKSYNDYVQGNYDLALFGFQDYLNRFSGTNLAPNAMYWIGECYYSKKEYAKAIDTFNIVYTKYPKSDKAPSALLKQGLIYMEMGNNLQAQALFEEVIKNFPNSPESTMAKERLEGLIKKGEIQ